MTAVLYVASEAYPLVKTGGLADVAGALPPALRDIGVDARLLVPGYPSVLTASALEPVLTGLDILPGVAPVALLEGLMPDGRTPLYVVDCPALFSRDGGPYQDQSGVEWADNAVRFGLLSRLAALLAGDTSPLPWHPDVLHLNDWQTGLAAAYRAFAPGRGARVVLSIHNIAFGGEFPASAMGALALPAAGFQMHGYEFFGHIGFLKAGVFYADHVTTVSPRYAEEIRTEAYGGGLHGLLATRGEGLTGIVNGIDETTWDPRTDPHLPATYDADDVAGKAACKAALQRELGLPERADALLLGIVGRLTHQKGLDLLVPALERLAGWDWQLAVVGTGDPQIEAALARLEERAPDRARLLRRYDEPLAHRIEAGADVFLMPSRFEPCGLNQMYSMRYGTPPIVRRTGGLADTVIDATPAALADGTATGIVLDAAAPEALAFAISRAFTLRADEAAWEGLRRAGMARDFGWAASARAYRALYERLTA